MHIELVSGMAGEIRQLKGKELQALGDQQLVRSGGAVDLLIGRCFLSVSNPGPYSFLTSGARPDWDKLLQGDHMDALLQIGALTFGDDYEFQVQCTAAGCRERFLWGLSLLSLPRKVLSPESAEQFARDNLFEVYGPGNERITHRLPTRTTEKAANKQKKSQLGKWGHIDSLMLRTVDVAGLTEPGKTPNPKRIRAYFEELSMSELLEIYEAMDEQNCGINTTIEVQCSHCGNIQDVHLPFGEAFFRPRKRKATTTTTGDRASESETTTAPSDATP